MTEKKIAIKLVEKLRQSGDRIVLAESCTGGLAAASITQINGVSDCFCGSAVTYLDRVKMDWLQVDKKTIDECTAVCEEVARQMTFGVLKQTRDATLAAAITGHVGPNAPQDLDGAVFVGFGLRRWKMPEIKVIRRQLKSLDRASRQREAVKVLFEFVLSEMRI